MIKISQIAVIVSSLFLTACASQGPEILTDEKFSSRVTKQGTTEFVYGLSWKNTSQASLLRDGRQQIDRRNQKSDLFPARTDRMALQANKQTKLELEDQAALGLKKKLTQQQLCSQGYEITEVFWKEANIRLLGYCF